MNYSTDHRDVITRTAIGRKLKRDALLGIIVALVLSLFAVLWFIYFEAAVVGSGVLHILVLVLSAVYFLCVVKAVYDQVKVLLAVKAGKYTVSEDVLLQRVVREYPWYGRRRYNRCTYMFAFASGKLYMCNGPRHTHSYIRHYEQQLSKEGDMFYVVVLDHAPEKIRLVYPGILFRYEDR